MSKFEYRGHVVVVQHGLSVLMATAADLKTGTRLPYVVTATAAEGMEVLMRRARLAVDDAVRANPAADLWQGLETSPMLIQNLTAPDQLKSHALIAPDEGSVGSVGPR